MVEYFGSDSNKVHQESVRLAVVEANKCNPKKCKKECQKICPVHRSGQDDHGKFCITVSKIANIYEKMCIGCGICVKACPFDAITITQVATQVAKKLIHRYGQNSFALYKLPVPRPGQVLGLMGENGVGKSTILNILSAQLKPNLGDFETAPDWSKILKSFRGSELQSFFTSIVENKLISAIKPQHIELIKSLPGKVDEYLKKNDERKIYKDIVSELEMESILDKNIKDLSGGELQRFCVAIVCLKDADVYMFDEPSSFLDIHQRLSAVKSIRKLCEGGKKYVIVIEHDLAILDYISDFVCIVYGTPNTYGIVTLPSSVKDGINQYLDGYIISDNMRIRDKALTFTTTDIDFHIETKVHVTSYPQMSKTFEGFHLDVEKGQYASSQVTVLVGPNGTGKSTFMKLLAQREKPNEAEKIDLYMSVAYKPQELKLTSKSKSKTVREILLEKTQSNFVNYLFINEVIRPLKLESIYDMKLGQLSGGQMQRVFVALCLGDKSNPDIFLLDEPSAHLDVDQRMIVAKAIKRFVLQSKKTAFVVEHDLIMTSYLADQIIVFEGNPGVKAQACQPESLRSGMNKFLKFLNVTFRRDADNSRPRINKPRSVKDEEQKHSGNYFEM